MTIQVFVRDVALPPAPPELVPYLSQLLQTAGHRIRWEPAHGAMLVDSPLEGYRVRCLVAAPHNRMAALIASGLARWVQLAGAAVVQGAERRADLTVVVRAELVPPGGSTSVHLASRPRQWFARRASLAGAAAAKLRGAVKIPVTVIHRWSSGKNELDVTVAAPENERLAQILSKAIWQGLMAHCCKGGAMLDVAMVATLPALESAPRPATQAAATPAPQPAATPAPQPEPTPAPQPEPRPAPQSEPRPAPQPEPRPAPQPEPRPAPQPDLKPAPRPDPKAAPQASRVIWSSDGPDPHEPGRTPHRPHSGTTAVRAASWSADRRH